MPPHPPPRLWGQCLLSVQHIPLGFCIRIAIWIKPLSEECVPGWKWRYGGLVRCEGATPWHMVAVAGHRRVGNSLKAAATWRLWIWMIRWSSENKRATPSAPVTTPHPQTLMTEFSKPLSWLGLVSCALIHLTNAALYGLWRDVQFSRRSPQSSLPCWPVLMEIKANCNWTKHGRQNIRCQVQVKAVGFSLSMLEYEQRTPALLAVDEAVHIYKVHFCMSRVIMVAKQLNGGKWCK